MSETKDQIDKVELLELQLAQERMAKLEAQAALVQSQTVKVRADVEAQTKALCDKYAIGDGDQILTDGKIKRSGKPALAPVPAEPAKPSEAA